MFYQKIKNRESGILIYGITPPKLSTTTEKLIESAQKTVERIKGLPIDALIVYDVQDESTRTKEERPFPFMAAHDPLEYATQYLSAIDIPKIIYRPAGKYTSEELSTWLLNLHQHNSYPVFVGVPSPDYVPKITLSDAYALWREYQEQSVIGAISIPERHVVLNDEDQRMFDKITSGVSYFVTQCVYNVDYSVKMLDALKVRCKQTNTQIPTVIFTLSTCGSEKTLHFMEWLGIHFPENIKKRLLTASSILDESAVVCLEIAKTLSDYCVREQIPFGFNIESVAIRKDEIDASINLLLQIEQQFERKTIVV